MGALARLWQESLPFLLLLSAAVGHVGLKYPKVNSYALYLIAISLPNNLLYLYGKILIIYTFQAH
jgi:hypothetical protein